MRVIAVLCCLTFLRVTLHAAEQEETVVQSGDAVALPGQQTHVVQPGDTLWDLTARFLNNPWYWPKVWSYNPQLTNPHFLYPGEVVRFYQGGGEETPARIEAAASREVESDTGEPMPPSREDAPPAKPPGGGVTVAGNRPLAYSGHRGMIVRAIELITPKELQETAEITNAFDDKVMLSTFDLVFLKYKKGAARPSVGQPLIAYRLVKDVEHPVTGKHYGYLTQITGTMEVVSSGRDGGAKGEELVTARITKAFDPVERGQLVAPQKGPILGELQETKNEQKIDGVIITGEYQTKQIAGQFHYVFVDRGTRDGVKNGNQFTVIRDRDYFKDSDGEPIPPQPVGRLVVVDAKETASLSLVVSSLIDLKAGDKVQMR